MSEPEFYEEWHDADTTINGMHCEDVHLREFTQFAEPLTFVTVVGKKVVLAHMANRSISRPKDLFLGLKVATTCRGRV